MVLTLITVYYEHEEAIPMLINNSNTN